MTARDLLVMARRRSGLSQQQLAQRSGVAQPQISRYESGTAEPPFATVQRLVDACDLSLGLRLYAGDRSLHVLAREQLEREPRERFRGLLLGEDAYAELDATLEVVGTVPDVLLSGDVAAVLHGSPRMLPTPTVALVARDVGRVVAQLETEGWLSPGADDRGCVLLNPGYAAIDVVQRPAGTAGYGDLVRDAVQMTSVPAPVVAVRDLLRIAEGSPDADGDLRALDLRAILDLAGEAVAA